MGSGIGAYKNDQEPKKTKQVMPVSNELEYLSV